MKKGFTLLELLVVVGMFTFLLAGIFAVLTTSDRSWQISRDKLIEQQQARRGIDQMVKLLRQSNASWLLGGVTYGITISDGNQRIDFYNPVFDALGSIAGLKKITFKLDPVNTSYLLKKEGNANSVIIAKDVQSINFGGGCAGCANYNCTTAAVDCPVVTIRFTSWKQANFTVNNQVTFRNSTLALPVSAVIEEPAQGEF